MTPLFADWIVSPTNFLRQNHLLSQQSTVLELGSGVSGIVAITLGPQVQRYIATDQDYVLKILKQNIADNMPVPKKMKSSARTKHALSRGNAPQPRIETLELDWETDSTPLLAHVLGDDGQQGVDMVIACDCIYNDALIEPFNSTCASICRLRSQDPQGKPTICVIAQQLRSHEVFEDWLKSFHRSFHVWRMPDGLLVDGLKENTGFVVHVGVVR